MFTIAALPILYLVVVAWPLASIDWREHRLPNRLVLPTFVIAFVAQLAEILLGESLNRLFGAFAISFLVFALGLCMNRYAGLGMGDVKLLAAMALSLGWFSAELVFVLTLVSTLLAAGYLLVLKIRRTGKLNQAIAFGPFLLGGFLVAVVTHLQ